MIGNIIPHFILFVNIGFILLRIIYRRPSRKYAEILHIFDVSRQKPPFADGFCVYSIRYNEAQLFLYLSDRSAGIIGGFLRTLFHLLLKESLVGDQL